MAGREDLQAADDVEQDGQGAEVRVAEEGGPAVSVGLRRVAEHAELGAGRAVEALEGGEGVGGEVEVGFELVHDEHADAVGVLDVDADGVAVLFNGGGFGDVGDVAEDGVVVDGVGFVAVGEAVFGLRLADMAVTVVV